MSVQIVNSRYLTADRIGFHVTIQCYDVAESTIVSLASGRQYLLRAQSLLEGGAFNLRYEEKQLAL